MLASSIIRVSSSSFWKQSSLKNTARDSAACLVCSLGILFLSLVLSMRFRHCSVKFSLDVGALSSMVSAVTSLLVSSVGVGSFACSVLSSLGGSGVAVTGVAGVCFSWTLGFSGEA